MKILVQRINAGTAQFHEMVSPAFIDGEFKPYFNNDVDIIVFAEKIGKNYKLKIQAKTITDFVCDRCLSDYQQNFEFEVVQIYTIGSSGLEGEDIVELPMNTIEIDISPLLNEMIILNEPIKKLCREDCRGICSGCGADLNKESCTCSHDGTDPRWAQLRKLIK